MRPIDADELKKTLKGMLFHGQLHHHFDAEKCAYNGALHDAIERIRNAPTVDAVPVVHARWIDSRQRVSFYMCSACKSGVKEHQPFYSNVWKYCPNCGARMDGEAHDDPG